MIFRLIVYSAWLFLMAMLILDTSYQLSIKIAMLIVSSTASCMTYTKLTNEKDLPTNRKTPVDY